MTDPRAYFPLTEFADPGRLPLGDLLDDVMERIWLTAPSFDPVANEGVIGVFVDREIAVTVPGIPAVQLALGSAAAGVDFDIRARFQPTPFIGIKVPLTLRIDAEILRPLRAGTSEPDLTQTHLNVALGTVSAGFDTDGNLTFDVPDGVAVPRCMIGSTGVIIEIGALRWLTPNTDLTNDPAIAATVPPGFTGIYLDDVLVEIPQLPAAAGALRMDDVFLGTGGLSGKLNQPNLPLAWDSTDFHGPLAGNLFGFRGGLTSVALEFRQSALVGCSITGDVFVPYLDKRVGLTLGLDGAGGVTASAGLPTSTPAETGVVAGGLGYLVQLDLGLLTLELDALLFAAPAGEAASVELSGRVTLNVAGLDSSPFDLKGLRIDNSGRVAIDGGWIPLAQAKSAGLKGFPLEITKIGFGAEDSGRRWLGLNGGIKLAEGLPLGASVEGLRISWLPKPTSAETLASVWVSLQGVGLEVKVPGAFELKGSVAFFDDDTGSGFQGHVELKLTALGMTVDATLLVGRSPAGDTFFFLFLAVDLPTGIPLFSTGAAFYGFAGLVATGMVPDRRDDENWYYGWYLRAPKGAGTDDPRAKWRVQPGAFAIGLGATIGTAPDDGFAFSAKPLLILVLPGPILLLQGKASFLAKRPGSQQTSQEGTLEALIVLDVPAKLFQANLAVTYKIDGLLDAAGAADVAFSWAPVRPADIWHLYLGEKQPLERRIRAELFKIFRANTYFQLWGTGIALGAWVGVAERYSWGPVQAWFSASIEGEAAVSWDPGSFEGMLRLSGDAGISVFGARIEIVLEASVTAKAPSPRFVSFRMHLGIKIDLWLIKFSFDVDLNPTWGPEGPLPTPALPIVDGLSWEHMLAQERPEPDKSLILEGATVPPDARPVVRFRRPVRDLAGLGAPGNGTLPADAVGPSAFSYQLGQLVLLRVDGGDRLVAAAGVLDVTAGAIVLPGEPALPNATGGRLLLLDGKRDLEVTGAGPGTLTVGGGVGLPDGRYPYRLRGPIRRSDVQVTAVQVGAAGTATVTMAADPGGGPDAFTGGSLASGASSWLVLGGTSNALTVRTPATSPTPSPPELPAVGPATLSAPPGPALAGVWLPAADSDPPATKLQLWARTPYAWFRRSEQQTLSDWEERNPDYACGPEITEAPICVGFGGLAPGPVPATFQVELLPGTASGDVQAGGTTRSRRVTVGAREGDLPGSGTLTLRFDPPVEELTVTCATREGGRITVLRQGAELTERFPNRDRTALAFGAPRDGIDELRVTGTLVDLWQVCFLPGWTCLAFDAASFPQRSTGRQTYAGVTFDSPWTMEVMGDFLQVAAPLEGNPALFPHLGVALVLPQPVTRVRVALAISPAQIKVYAGMREVAAAAGGAGTELVLVAPRGDWIDRIVVLDAGLNHITLQRICYDAGPFGWHRYEQWFRGQTVQRSVEAFYQEDPVLPSGQYRLDVVTAWDDELDQTGSPTWSTTGAAFTVGPPPLAEVTQTTAVAAGGRYPKAGPLSELSTYVSGTLPAAGERPFYRSYDVAVSFGQTYVTRLYLAANERLTVAVVDANGIDRRAGAVNVWSRGHELDLAELSREETAWIKTLHGDGTQRCAAVDLAKVMRNEAVSAGAGELLAPAALHAGELRAGTRRLFRFEFVTSRFAGFAHHLSTFDGRCRTLPGARLGPDAAALTVIEQPIAQARAALTAARDALDQATAAVAAGSPTRAQLDAFEVARLAMPAALAALAAARARAFAQLWDAYVDRPPGAALPTQVELARLIPAPGSTAPAALLLESPEPLNLDRVTVEVIGQSAVLPRRRRLIRFDDGRFGAPDRGTFVYGGLEWTSDSELRVVAGAVEPRVQGPWILKVALPPTTSVTAHVQVADGGSAIMTAAGLGAATPLSQGPTAGAAVALTATGSDISSVTLSGTGISLVSVSVDEVLQPVPPSGPLRLIGGRLPTNALDKDHFVSLTAFGDVPVGGWSIRWLGIADVGQAGRYVTFPAGLSLRDGRLTAVFGGRPDPAAVAGADTYGNGGADGDAPPADGAVVQLVNPGGQVVHELTVLPEGSYASSAASASQLIVCANEDGTRLLVLPRTGSIDRGHLRMDLRFDGEVGPGQPRLTIGGKAQTERAHLVFTTD